jgi:chromatin segregation and condensation protein Rec8/ScpA/Scc1 (kleisin family)
LRGIDEILFGEKEKKISKSLERIELDEEIPSLIPRSPIPRMKKVTLQELIDSLNKAIKTENRRIKKEIINKNALRETSFSMPKRKISIKDKIKQIYDALFDHFKENKDSTKITYTDFIGQDKEERIISFYPLLQLEHQQKVWLEQQTHFGEIDIWLKQTFIKQNGDPFAELKKELLEADQQETEKEKTKEERIKQK